MNDNVNFWGTLEVYCVCAGMDYEKDYLVFFKNAGHTYAPLCKEAYAAFAKAIEVQMEHDFKKDESDHTLSIT